MQTPTLDRALVLYASGGKTSLERNSTLAMQTIDGDAALLKNEEQIEYQKNCIVNKKALEYERLIR